MTPRKFHLHNGQMGSALTIRITPKASKNEISDILSDGTIKVRLTSPPNEGKINAALINFLAGILDVSPTAIEIVAGDVGKDKLVSITGMDSDTVHKKIMDFFGKA